MELIILSTVLILFIIIVIFIAAYAVTSAVLVQQGNKKQTNSYNEFFDKYSGLAACGQKQTFSILSPRGYKLSCIFLKQDEQLKKDSKVVIFTPILNKKTNLNYYQQNSNPEFINIFFENGFDVLLYDIEPSAEIPFCSMGYYEKDDLKVITNWVFDCYDSDAVVGTYGLGTGAATAIMHASEEKRLDFIIIESLFTNLKSYLKNKLKFDYRISSFPILNISELIIKKRGGFSIKEVSPLQIFKNDEISAPIFFIYGENDIYTPPQMLVDLYNNKSKGYKKYYFAKNAGHCESFNKNPKEYKKNIDDFFKETGIIKIEEFNKE